MKKKRKFSINFYFEEIEKKIEKNGVLKMNFNNSILIFERIYCKLRLNLKIKWFEKLKLMKLKIYVVKRFILIKIKFEINKFKPMSANWWNSMKFSMKTLLEVHRIPTHFNSPIPDWFVILIYYRMLGDGFKVFIEPIINMVLSIFYWTT